MLFQECPYFQKMAAAKRCQATPLFEDEDLSVSVASSHFSRWIMARKGLWVQQEFQGFVGWYASKLPSFFACHFPTDRVINSGAGL
jgi:hypothetical protein